MKILIFSGTTEGRRLSEMLSEAGIRHFVCVASEYGSEVMSTDSLAAIRVGKMNENEMEDYLNDERFGESDVIVDATHPYAKEASDNIKAAAARSGCTLYRVCRKSEDRGRCSVYSSMDDFARSIDKSDGNILLTTGTNTLERYCGIVSEGTLARTYVRVLPATESLDICRDLGIKSSHIIAMQGPFSEEMNRAVMRQYLIRHVLTKDSGESGGFTEKINAAAGLGVSIHLLERPDEDDGLGIEEVYEKITGHPYVRELKVILAGAGMGSDRIMTRQVSDAVAHSDAVFAAKRILDGISAKRKYEMYNADAISHVLDENNDIRTAVVLFSGDTGFYSGAGSAYEKLCKLYPDADIRFMPGISSVSYLAAKLGENYDGAVITSIHGRNSEDDIKRLVSDIRHNKKTFALMSGDSDVRMVCRQLLATCPDVLVCIGKNLSYEDEKITKISCEEATQFTSDGIITVLFINRTPGTGL